MKLLLIEDDPEVARFLAAHLPARGFAIDSASEAASGITLARTGDYDLVLLDLNLPDLSGESVIAALRGLKEVPPILMLTVVSDVSSKVRVLGAGADDYLVKPFAFDELVARIRALLRRSPEIVPDVLTAGDLSLDMAKQTVRRGKRAIRLTRTEFGLLAYLLRHRGTVVSKAALIEGVWDSSTDVFSSAIDTHMANLRRKLGIPEVMETVRGRGYRIGR